MTSSNLSPRARRALLSTGADEYPLVCVEIHHPSLLEPARVVCDNDDFPMGVDRLWLPGQAVAAGDVAAPSEYTGRYYVCTQAGITGATEPEWPGDGQTVADGSAVWSVGGPQYRACAFRYTLPDDLKGQLPRADLALDNVGRELMDVIEESGGAVDARVRIFQAMRATPDVIEWQVWVGNKSIRATMQEVVMTLGYENLLELPACGLSYRPDVAPGLF